MTNVDRSFNKTYTRDLETVLHDGAANVTADGGGAVGGAAKVLHVGEALFEADLVLDLASVDATTGDETYVAIFQLSETLAFSTPVEKSRMTLLNTATAGRWTMPVDNTVKGEIYPYCRIYFDVGGTTPILACQAFLGKR